MHLPKLLGESHFAFCIHLKVNVSLREGQERPGPPLTRQVLARLRSPCTELVLQEPSNYSHTLVPAVLKRFLIIFGSSYNINQKSSEKAKSGENKGGRRFKWFRRACCRF